MGRGEQSQGPRDYPSPRQGQPVQRREGAEWNTILWRLWLLLDGRSGAVGHGGVGLDAVLRDDMDAVRLLLLLGRRPGEVVAADLDVVVGKLAVLVVVHAKELRLLRGAQVQAWNEVDELGNDGRHDEGVGRRSQQEGDLDVELLVVPVEEAASDSAGRHAVEANDVVGRK